MSIINDTTRYFKKMLNLKEGRFLKDNSNKMKTNDSIKFENNMILIGIKFRNILVFMKLLVLLHLFIPIMEKNKYCMMDLAFSKITYKIKGSGYKNVLFQNFDYDVAYIPDLIYINGEKKMNLTENIL